MDSQALTLLLYGLLVELILTAFVTYNIHLLYSYKHLSGISRRSYPRLLTTQILILLMNISVFTLMFGMSL